MAAPMGNKNAKGMKPNKTSFKKGVKASPETQFKKGISPWNKGLKGVMKAWNKGVEMVRGENHHNWKGGKGTDRHRKMRQLEYITWRQSVFEKDNYTCQDCGLSGVYLMAHHIKSWSKFPELRYVIENGITYCKKCHAKHDKYYAKFYKEESK